MKATFHFVKNEIPQQSVALLYRILLDRLLKVHNNFSHINIFAGDTSLYESISKFNNPCESLGYLFSMKTGWDRIVNMEPFMREVIHAITITSIPLDVALKLHDGLLSENSYVGANETTPAIEKQWAFLIGDDFIPKFTLQNRNIHILTNPDNADNTEYIETMKDALESLPFKNIKVYNYDSQWKDLPHDELCIMAREERESIFASELLPDF